MTILHHPKESFDPKLPPIAEAGSGSGKRAAAAWAAGISLSTLVFLALINTLVGLLTSPPDLGHITDKWSAYEREVSEYTTLFLGTSRTMRGVDPLAFDARMRELGCESSSFNFGIPGAPLAEVIHVLELIESDPPPELRYVFIEPYTANYRRWDALLADQRTYFYTWPRLAVFLRDIASMPGTEKQRMSHLARFAAAFAYTQIDPGRLAKRLLPPARAAALPESDLSATRGFQDLDSLLDQDRYLSRREYFLQRTERFRGEVEDLREHPEQHLDSAGRAAVLIDFTNRVRRLGAEPVITLLPGISTTEYERDLEKRLAELAPDLRVLSFNDPSTFPALFELGLWFDQGHLNKPGATQLSRRLAASVCRATDRETVTADQR